jgi:hypothetical protein
MTLQEVIKSFSNNVVRKTVYFLYATTSRKALRANRLPVLWVQGFMERRDFISIARV